tara:strand:- start:91 stop:528 length:438 start_codon:yes stop_codon:yes gene_type:complete
MTQEIAATLEERFISPDGSHYDTISITRAELHELRDRDRDLEMEKLRRHVSFLRSVVHTMSLSDDRSLLIEMTNSALKETPESLYTKLEQELDDAREFHADLRKERDELFEMVERYSEAVVLDDKMLRPYLVGLNEERLRIDHVE